MFKMLSGGEEEFEEIPKGYSESVYQRREQTTQWPKEKSTKGQKDKQRSTKHTHKTKDQVTNPTKNRG